jgi:hypothetical protein
MVNTAALKKLQNTLTDPPAPAQAPSTRAVLRVRGRRSAGECGGEASRSNRLYRRNAFFNLCDACLAYASYGVLAATLRSYFFE